MIKSLHMRQAVVVVLAAAAASAAPVAVRADSRPTTLVVSYADLAVSTPEGARELRARLDAAARQVCGAVRYGVTLDRVALYRACLEDAVADALHRADRGRLAGLFVVQVRPPAGHAGAP